MVFGVISVLILSLFLAWRNVVAKPITVDNHIGGVGSIKCLTGAEISHLSDLKLLLRRGSISRFSQLLTIALTLPDISFF